MSCNHLMFHDKLCAFWSGILYGINVWFCYVSDIYGVSLFACVVYIQLYSAPSLSNNCGKIRLYDVKGMHLDFLCPFFFWTFHLQKTGTCRNHKKHFQHNKKMNCVAPRQTRMPSNFWRKNKQKRHFSIDDNKW